MNYIETRKIIDEIIDGKKDVAPEGKLNILLEYLIGEKEEHESRLETSKERYQSLSEKKAPEIILLKEVRLSGKHAGFAEACDDAALIAKCLSVFPEKFCSFQALNTIEDSKKRGCRDCRYRFSNYEGGKDFESSFYCGIHSKYDEDEKELIRRELPHMINESTDENYTEEEIEELISKNRPVLGECDFNTPCKYYMTAEMPLWMCSDKEIECLKGLLKKELPDFEEEGWDEQTALCNLVFCKRNEINYKVAMRNLLNRIFGKKATDEDEYEEESEEGEKPRNTEDTEE